MTPPTEAPPLRASALLWATLACLLFLMLVNALAFPLLFPDGPPLEYRNPRAEPRLGLNALGVAVTALLLVLTYALARPRGVGAGALLGLLLGLFAALPSALHTHALVDGAFAARVGPVLWTALVTGGAGGVAALVERWTRVWSAPESPAPG